MLAHRPLPRLTCCGAALLPLFVLLLTRVLLCRPAAHHMYSPLFMNSMRLGLVLCDRIWLMDTFSSPLMEAGSSSSGNSTDDSMLWLSNTPAADKYVSCVVVNVPIAVEQRQQR